MDALLQTYWPVIVIAIVLGIIAGWIIFRPRQSVRLSEDEGLRRPHMEGIEKSGEGRSIIDQGAAATADIAGQALQAEVHEQLPGATGEPDDLKRLKGVGPKLAAMLNGMGITRFDQIAKLTPAQVEAIDAKLGAFSGRFQRDRIVEQADYLARGDTAGYEVKFGKL
ncbi:hypothetical protein [Sphingomicrobium lutaoense]|uniref:Putative flap endonuclease-1-like 5' DNA nuclease n=1 Tax=Sphingomicrobium lutaoense TaxID=515949 RepID=A0A839Z428_9SPHN|nr:hypothetical protein [Sphingomicrobium lutaoense]MBB3764583.1 putative flap endonuclease-1-like 5' DNA nuclease [Sphingomicrobium lutaoense]